MGQGTDRGDFVSVSTPDAPIPVDRLVLTKPARIRVEGDLVVVLWEPRTIIPAPPEMYLRDVLPIDTSDVDAVIDFCARLSVPYGLVDPEYWEPGDARHQPTLGASSFLSDLLFDVRKCQAMVAHYVAFVDGEQTAPVWDFYRRSREARPEHRQLDEEKAWNLWLDLQEPLLAYFHPRLVVSNSRRTVRPPSLDLAAVVAAQIFNAIVQKAEIRTCPFCGMRFSKQEGRAEHGQNRSRSVTYCTSRCARAKADRDYRVRKRAQQGDPV